MSFGRQKTKLKTIGSPVEDTGSFLQGTSTHSQDSQCSFAELRDFVGGKHYKVSFSTMLFKQLGKMAEVRSLIRNYCSWLILVFCFQHEALALCFFFSSIYAMQMTLFVIKWQNTRKNLVGWVGNHVSPPQCQAGLSELLDQVISWSSGLKLASNNTHSYCYSNDD